MHLNEFIEQTDGLVRRYDYEESTVVVADLGLRDEDVDIDVVDGTAMVVVDRDGESTQHDVELPEGDVAKALINNGVVTIEVSQ